jgi:hypothetical protein
VAVEPNAVVGPPDPVPQPAEAGLTPPGPPAADPPKKPGPEWKSPEALSRYDQETVELINAKHAEVETARQVWNEANEAAKSKKISWQGLSDQLHALIGERQEHRGKPVQRTLFDERPAAPDLPDLPAAPADDRLANLFREVPIGKLQDFGARSTDVTRLQAGRRKEGPDFPVNTVGDLADYSANAENPGYERRLSDFVGIGPGAAGRLEEAAEGFYRWWNHGGLAEFAASKGIDLDGHAPQPGPGAAGAGPGDGDGPGQPDAAGPAAEPGPADAPAPEGEGAEPFVPPQGGPDEYGLGD